MTERFGRKDWIHLALGVITSIVLGAIFPAETARELFRFAGGCSGGCFEGQSSLDRLGLPHGERQDIARKGLVSVMPLPEFNEFGDLPEGTYQASLVEVVARFGTGTSQRTAVTERLRRIHQLAVGTGYLERILVFGSYVSDVDERPDMLLDEPLESFLAFWQTKRDGRRRGVVEISP